MRPQEIYDLPKVTQIEGRDDVQAGGTLEVCRVRAGRAWPGLVLE